MSVTARQADYIEADQRLTTARHSMETAQAQYKNALTYWRQARARMSQSEQDGVDKALGELNEPEMAEQAR